MAEGLLGGILGEEEERSETESSESLTASHAFAAAIAAKLSGNDPGVALKTQAFLEDQSQLLRVQKKHLEDEHTVRLATLAGQKREGDLRRTGIRIRIVFQLFVAMVAALIGAGVIFLVHDALTSRQVVIEPFHAPADFPARGIDGTVIASGILDELTNLQIATRSAATALGVSGAWASNIKLDVPETGISITELSQILRERFGHDVHIEGDLVEAPGGGLALTTRGNGVPPQTFVGKATELNALTVKAAEYVYSRSQPARWAQYLIDANRNTEAVEFCRATISGTDPLTRAELFNDWANALEGAGGSQQEALQLYQEAVKLQPGLWRSYANLMNTYVLLGNEEEAWRAGERMRDAAGGRPGRAPDLYYENMDLLTWDAQAALTAILADAAASAGAGTQVASTGQIVADMLIRMHDPDAALLALKTTREDSRDHTFTAIAHFVEARSAMDAGDFAKAATEFETFGEEFKDPIVFSGYPGYQCWIAVAEEAAGHPEKADAVLNAAGTFVDCYRFRGDILDGRHDWAGAQKVYADAIALAPDLPASYYSWGLALMRHGNLAAGVAQFKAANQHGPHWADPLKAWGDALLKQGNREEALVKYNEALQYAPNWSALKQAQESAAKQTI